MTSWTNKDISTSPVAARVDCGDDPARATPFCDAYCVLFFGQRLHTIACDIANHRDPILPDRTVVRDATAKAPHSGGDDAA